MADDLEALGAPPEAVAAERETARQAEDEAEIAVWPEAMPVLTLFLSCRTQWRVMPHGGRLGLDYPAVEWVAKRLDVAVDGQVLTDLQAMESEALAVWAEARDRDARRMKETR